MTDAPVVVQEVRWPRLFPWLRLGRVLGLTIGASQLLLGVLGLVLLRSGWVGLDQVFGPPAITVRLNLATTPEPLLALQRTNLGSALTSASWRVAEPALVLIEPFRHIFAPRAGAAAFFHAVLAALWGVLVGGIMGGAIARITVLRATESDPVGLIQALRYALAHWDGLVGAPLVPFVAVVFFTLLCALGGLLYWIPAPIGPTAAGALLFLPLLAGLMMAILLVGLALVWPLMHATTAAEGEDFYDALSRSYSYVNQRAGRYVVYIVLAWALGIVGLIVVDLFAWLVIHLANWGLGFGAPADRLEPMFGATAGSSAGSLASTLHMFWLSVVGLVAHGWVYSYFWTAASLIYLLLRLDVDGVPWHVVYHPAGDENPDTAPMVAASGLPAVGDTIEAADPKSVSTAGE